MGLKNLIESIIVASRWLLAVFYVGLAVTLLLYAIQFSGKVVKLAQNLFIYSENAFLLAVLGLIDSALVAGLLVMVMLSSYDNFVARLDGEAGTSRDVAAFRLDPGSLKLKLALAIVAISSIHLLQAFMDVDRQTDDSVMWRIAIHLTFLAGALMLGLLDRWSAAKKG